MPISKADITDVSSICALVNNAYRGEESKNGWTTEAHLLEGIRINGQTLLKYFQNPAVTILKFVENDKIDGCVYLETRVDKLYLGMLCVTPLLQNKGIGKKLLLAAEYFAAENNLNILMMTVISTRLELIDWYQRRGYVLTGEKEPFHYGVKFGIPRQPIELVVLEKHL